MVRLGMASESPRRARRKSSPRPGGVSTGRQGANPRWRSRRLGGAREDFGSGRIKVGDTASFICDQAQASLTASLINSATDSRGEVGLVINIIIILANTPLHTLLRIPALAYPTVNILVLLVLTGRIR